MLVLGEIIDTRVLEASFGTSSSSGGENFGEYVGLGVDLGVG